MSSDEITPASNPTREPARKTFAGNLLGPSLALFGCLAIIGGVASQLSAQDRTATGQKKLVVDWADEELRTFSRVRSASTTGPAALANLRLPVLAFDDVPQLVKNALGPDARPTVPRKIITDAKSPYYYSIEDTYGDVTISVSADLRINHDLGPQFQTTAPTRAPSATPGTRAPAKITIVDGSNEGNQESIAVEYTVQRFPNIPYTVTIECGKKSKAQCKDTAVITKDQLLLKVISLGKGSD
jgi:hypothetical protein